MDCYAVETYLVGCNGCPWITKECSRLILLHIQEGGCAEAQDVIDLHQNKSIQFNIHPVYQHEWMGLCK